jgi:hypothetical protein
VAGHHEKLGRSSLIHEIGHCYYRHVLGEDDDGDRLHKNDNWWKLVDEIDAQLVKLGW